MHSIMATGLVGTEGRTRAQHNYLRLFAQDRRTAESILGLLTSKRPDLRADGRQLKCGKEAPGKGLLFLLLLLCMLFELPRRLRLPMAMRKKPRSPVNHFTQKYSARL
jgi:hypothetical protein